MTADSKGVQNQGMFLQVLGSLDIMLHCAHVCVCLCLRTSVCVPVGLCVPCF